jgi:glycosyltransferase involved in cell wall biosynthesis
VVLRDIPALRDALPDQQCGMLSAADTRSLAEALGRALDRKWDRTAIARVGGARSWQQVAAEVEDEFRRVLALQAGTKVRTRSAASSVASGTSY